MKKLIEHCTGDVAIIALVATIAAVSLCGCVAAVGPGGYSGNVGVGVGVDYYEPVGVVYGGWGPGYNVGPYRGGPGYRDGGGPHAYRSAPASHPMPSIPSRPHH